MAEQSDKQPATPEKGAEASATAAGNAPVQGATITPDAVQAYLKSNPDAWKLLKAPVKVDGKEMEVPLADVRDGYQIRSASQARFEAAAAKEKELAEREARLAEQGDPIKQLLERLQPPKPQQPDDPYAGIDFADPFAATPKVADVTRALYSKNLALEAKLKDYETKLPEVEKKANEAMQAQRDYELRVRVETDFERARSHNPAFTGRLTVRDGKWQYDLGDNPTLTAEAIRLANSEIPDKRLNGIAGNSMSLDAIVDALQADEERRVDERRAAIAKAKEERLKNMAGIAPTGAVMPEPTTKTTIMPTDDAKTRIEKARLIKQELLEQMQAAGVKVTPGAV